MADAANVKPRASFMGITASPIYNNLTATSEGCLIFAHKDKVVIARALGAVPLTQLPEHLSVVQSVKAHNVRGRTMLIVTNKLATCLYDVERDAPLLSIPNGGSPSEDARGSAVVNFNDIQCVMIGYGDGQVGIYQVHIADFTIIATNRSPVHPAAVTSICSGPPESGVAALSGDVNGELRFWNAQLQPFLSQASPGDCVTSCVLFGPYAAASYGSGAIRLFAAATAELRVSIAAHSRWINAIAYSPVSNQLASVGDDSIVNVWNMPTETDGRVSLARQFIEPNRLIAGVAFTGGGKIVATAAFECDSLQLYSIAH